MADVESLIVANDLDELIREVDRRCETGDWAGLMDLRDRCARSHEMGRQMWPAASHAEHRLALEAPGRWAAQVVVEGAAHLGVGPIAEVAASSHTWEELAEHLPAGPLRTVVALERVVRGEDLAWLVSDLSPPAELPLRLAPWEPEPPEVRYLAWKVEDPPPRLAGSAVPVEGAGQRLERGPEETALADLARTWVEQSEGRVRTVGVRGDGPAAIAALDPAALATPITLTEAVSLMSWTAATGGVHGRRRGAAAGRTAAWWTLAVLCGLDDDWPPDPDELGAAGAELDWWVWQPSAIHMGWSTCLAVADPLDGLAWALDAHDPG